MENRKTIEKVKNLLFHKKENYLRYEEICNFLNTHQEDAKEVDGLIEYHKNFALNEKILEKNGILQAIQYFYFKDLKEESLKDDEERMNADLYFLQEFEKKFDIYQKILLYRKEKEMLEKKLKIEPTSNMKIQR